MTGAERMNSNILRKREVADIPQEDVFRRDVDLHLAENRTQIGANFADPRNDRPGIAGVDGVDVEDREPSVLIADFFVVRENDVDKGLIRHHQTLFEVLGMIEPVNLIRVVGEPASDDLDFNWFRFAARRAVDGDQVVANLRADGIQLFGHDHRFDVRIAGLGRVGVASLQDADMLVEVRGKRDEAPIRELARR